MKIALFHPKLKLFWPSLLGAQLILISLLWVWLYLAQWNPHLQLGCDRELCLTAMLVQQRGTVGWRRGEVSQCQQCGFVIFFHDPCVSVFDQFLWERKQRRVWGQQHTVTNVTFWICRGLQSSARSPQERCYLTKPLHGLFISPADLWFGSRIALSQMRKIVWNLSSALKTGRRRKERRRGRRVFLISTLHGPQCSIVQSQDFPASCMGRGY